MTDQTQDHAPFDELAAGHVLHALEPEDEQRFLRHADGCPQCLVTLAGFRDAAAALAEALPPLQPDEQLGARILAAALDRPALDGAALDGAAPEGAALDRPGRDAEQADDSTGTAAPATVVPLRQRPARRWLRPAAAAAAAALIVAGGVWAGLDMTASKTAPPAASCTHRSGCSQVSLTTASGPHRQAARVLVMNGSVSLVPAALPPDNTAHQIYVLWQINPKTSPLAIGGFDVRRGSHAVIKVGTLPGSYGKGSVFAISLERGRKVPPAPHIVVALGHA